ncbi:hypothetical protein [Brevundimonas vesicularis]|uniref:hypothetical protein n=1 Tax=Brevundimonas vesicularis TaxID=41276 RepID=UPI0022ABD2C6|nr:hypothetical protein [Brevundimonas vesicularis]
MPDAVALAREGLAFAPDSLVLIRYAAVIAGESGDRALGAEVIPRLTNEPEDVALALRFHANERDWAALASIHHTAASGLPESEVVMAETLGAIGALKISGATDLAPGLGTVLEATGDDPRAAVVVADFAMDEGLEEVAETAYDRAVGLIDDDSHVARRQMVSALAMRRGDWSVVADMLSGHIDESRDNDETRRLALAFVNERPIKQRGLRFFRELASDLANRPTYLRLAGLFHFNHGALGQAETALRRAIVVSNDLLSYLALFETLRRRNKADEIAPLIAAVDARTLRGTPGEQMGFAQAWRDVGEGEAAIAFAYDVLQSAPDDPAAALGYLGLVMSDPTEGLIPAAPVVAVDTWVRLEDDLGESRAFLIVAADPRPAAGIVTPDHPLIAVALGLGAKSEFTIEDRLTGPHIWRIAEIKHRYLHALHDVMLNFETRFPNAKGLQRARMREGETVQVLVQPLAPRRILGSVQGLEDQV